MRNKLLILILLILMLIGVPSVSAASNPYNQKEKVPNNEQDKMTNCTWYAWQQAYDNMGVELPGFGNAKNWYSKAKSLGWHVGTEAKPNSIAVWSSSTYGHVGYVVSVNGSRMIINEGGVYDIEREFDESGNMISMKYVAYNGTGIYNGNWASTVVGGPRYEEEDSSGSKLIGFIYLDYIPTTTTIFKNTDVKKDSSTTTTNKTTSTTTLKSTSNSIKTTTADKKDEVDNKEVEEVSNDENIDETINLKSILPYLILISLSLLLLLLVLAKITKNEK